MTAGELLRILERDPAYVQRRTKQQAQLAEIDAFYRESEAPLLSDLATMGIEVASVYDLVNDVVAYERAIPLLLDHLHRDYPDAIREGIARALGTPSARTQGWTILVSEYRRTPNEKSRVKDGLAVALAGACDSSVIDELISLAREKQNGNSRILLLSAIRASRLSRAKKALAELAEDPQLALEIKSWRA